MNNLWSFILHGKFAYNNRRTFLQHNPDVIKYMRFIDYLPDSLASHRYILFDSIYLSHILSNIYGICDITDSRDILDTMKIAEYFNRQEIYTITNIVSYYMANNDIDKTVAEMYLLNIYMKTNITNGFNYTNIARRKYKNVRVKLCWKLFKEVFNYEWEYFNINLYDLFDIIYCIVYKRYNALYDALYNISIHKSLDPMKTLYILLSYKEDIDIIRDDIDESQNDTLNLFNYTIIYILYNYIENIYPYIKKVNLDFKRLIPVIIEKCLEIKEGIEDDNRIPNNLKLMFLKKNNRVYNLYTYDNAEANANAEANVDAEY